MHLCLLLVSSCLALSLNLRFAAALSKDDLFSYPRPAGGNCGSGGNCVDIQDDGILTVETEESFPFYGMQSPRSVKGSVNGIIFLGQSVTRFRDMTLSATQSSGAIAVFYHDTDLLGNGMMYHESTTNQTTFQRANQLVRQGFVDAPNFEAQTIIVTTYLEVGYFRQQYDLLNTYQSLIVTDYKRTFLILLYVDIQWLRAQTYNRYAQVGIYSGDQRLHYELPDSATANLTKLTNFTNMDIPGLSLYQISGHQVEPAGCSSTDAYPIRIYPHFGSELGGTLVRLQGYCFSAQDSIEAEFGSRRVSCAYRSTLAVLCVVPPLPNPRTLAVKLLVNGEVKGQTSYTTLSSDSSYGVDLVGSHQTTSPVFLTVSERVSLTYNPTQVFPGEIPGSFLVDVLLYGMNLETGEWAELRKLSEGMVNTGSLTVTLLGGLTMGVDIQPIAVFVGTSLAHGTSEQSSNLAALRSSNLRAGIFAPVYYFANRASLNGSGRSLCDEWYNTSSDVSNGTVQCPAILDQAHLPTSGLELFNLTSVTGKDGYRSQWLTTFHSRANVCYRQSVVLDYSSSVPPTQQECCYNNKGQLLAGSPDGGTVSAVAAEYDGRRHFLEDVRPYLLCCSTDFPNCGYFYQRRPSSRGEGHLPKQPAWVVGDPHFITFDGTRYTFNGYGEFTLLQTDSGQFTIQGRMEPFPDNASGSILTALAVNYDGDRINIVTNEAGPNRGGLDVYLNDNHITPEYLPKMYFNKFMLGYNTSRILRVLFLNGVQLECQTSNGNITQFLVGVPSSLKGQVSGLFGTYNGDMADDLSPLTSSGSLGSPLQTTNIETVHSEFGLSWIVRSEANSSFQYFAGETFLTVKDESFQPVFRISAEVLSQCDNDFFCAYDAAVTKDIDFAMHTLASVEEAVRVEKLSGLITCSPECSAGGVCQSGNLCFCSAGFTGSRCETNIIENCNATGLCPPPSVCVLQGGSYTCQCPDGKTGSECSIATTSAAGGVISTVSIAIIGVGGVVFILGILIPIITVAIIVMVHRRRKTAEDVKDSSGEAVGDYSTTFDSKLNADKKTSTLSLPPSYSDLNLNDRNGIQLTKFNMANGGKGVATIPENEPEYAAITDSNYQNVSNNPLQQRRCSEGVILNQANPPLQQQELPQQQQQASNGRMQASDRTQSHTVIATSPGINHSSNERKALFPSNSSSNVAARAPSQCSLSDRHMQPWYQSSIPSVVGATEAGAVPGARVSSISPTHHPIPSPTGVTLPDGISVLSAPHGKASTLPYSHSQPTSDRYTPNPGTPSGPSSMSVQSIPAGASHKPLRANHSNPGSGNVRVSSRQSSTLNRSIPELLNDSNLPASDV